MIGKEHEVEVEAFRRMCVVVRNLRYHPDGKAGHWGQRVHLEEDRRMSVVFVLGTASLAVP